MSEEKYKERWRDRTVEVINNRYQLTPALMLGNQVQSDLVKQLGFMKTRDEKFRTKIDHLVDMAVLKYWKGHKIL